MYKKCLECIFLKTQKIVCITSLPMEGTKKKGKVKLKKQKNKTQF